MYSRLGVNLAYLAACDSAWPRDVAHGGVRPGIVGAVTAFGIGRREAAQSAIVVALVAGSVPPPWTTGSKRRFLAVLGFAVGCSAVVAVAVYASAASLSDRYIVAVEVVLAVLAAVMLSATAVWAAR